MYNWALPYHICVRNGLTPATSAPGPFALCGQSLTPKPWLACAVRTQMHYTCNVQHATCNVQRDTCSLQQAVSTYNVQHAAQPATRGTSESSPAWRIRISPGPSGARRTSLCVGSDARSVCRECNWCSVQHAVRDTQRSKPRQRALQPPCNLQRTAHGYFGAGSDARSIAPLEPAAREKLLGRMPRIGGRQ